MSNTFNRLRCLWCVVLCLAAASAFPCTPESGNEYEKVYCQLKRTGQGETLPSLYDFRKNPPLTQAYLLKKPAERAGIPLRIPQRDNTETVDRQSELLFREDEPKLESVAVQQKTMKSVKVPPARTLSLAPSAQPERDSSLEACVLQLFELRCPQMHYRLVTNEANQNLKEGALSDAHRLNLPAYVGQNRDAYLKEAYGRYLEGMMEIGLGASTLSYTKFVRLFDHIAAQKLDFAQRFEAMYHFLKEDKSRIGVNTRPAIAEGFTTRFCSDLKPGLLACEHQRDNYLFVALQTP